MSESVDFSLRITLDSQIEEMKDAKLSGEFLGEKWTTEALSQWKELQWSKVLTMQVTQNLLKDIAGIYSLVTVALEYPSAKKEEAKKEDKKDPKLKDIKGKVENTEPNKSTSRPSTQGNIKETSSSPETIFSFDISSLLMNKMNSNSPIMNSFLDIYTPVCISLDSVTDMPATENNALYFRYSMCNINVTTPPFTQPNLFLNSYGGSLSVNHAKTFLLPAAHKYYNLNFNKHKMKHNEIRNDSNNAMDKLIIDEFVCNLEESLLTIEIHDRIPNSNKIEYVFAIAKFSLLDLCNGSNQFTLQSNLLPVYPTVGFSMETIANNLRNKSLQSSTSHAPALINPYINSLLSITVSSLAMNTCRPFPSPLEIRLKFGRIVVIFPYNDSDTLTTLTRIMADRNAAAMNMSHLPRRALCNAQLTIHDKSSQGSLDILTGFSVLDSQVRIVVMEGLVDGKALTEVHDFLKSLRNKNNAGVRVLINPNVTFRNRMYANFELELKMIKLNCTLSKILAGSTMYTRSHIPLDCFDALKCLSGLKSVDNISNAKIQALFPTESQLMALERRFGDFVSDQDIEGLSLNSTEVSNVVRSSSSLDVNNVTNSTVIQSTKDSSGHDRRKAPTDTHNDAYLQTKLLESTQKKPDYIQEHIKEHTTLRRKKAASGPIPPWGTIYGYSGQKLNYTTWQLNEMRKKKLADTSNSYVYSTEFSSSTFPLVDDSSAARHEEEEASRKLFRTPSGFTSGSQKSPEERYRHPNRPCTARIEELQSPWKSSQPSMLVPRETVLDSTGKAKPLFDNQPIFSSEFGYPGNDEWKKSVHLVGEGVEKAKQDAIIKAKEQWQSKLVVEDPSFRVLWTVNNERKPSSTDKLNTLLRDPPKKLILTKTFVPPPPVTMFLSEPFKEQTASSTLLGRSSDKSKFITPNDFNGGAVGHYLYEKKNQVRKLVPIHNYEKNSKLWRSS